MFVPFSSSSFYPLINRLDTVGLPDFLASYSIFVLSSAFISFAYNICLVYYVSTLVSRGIWLWDILNILLKNDVPIFVKTIIVHMS